MTTAMMKTVSKRSLVVAQIAFWIMHSNVAAFIVTPGPAQETKIAWKRLPTLKYKVLDFDTGVWPDVKEAYQHGLGDNVNDLVPEPTNDVSPVLQDTGSNSQLQAILHLVDILKDMNGDDENELGKLHHSQTKVHASFEALVGRNVAAFAYGAGYGAGDNETINYDAYFENVCCGRHLPTKLVSVHALPNDEIKYSIRLELPHLDNGNNKKVVEVVMLAQTHKGKITHVQRLKTTKTV